MLLFKTIAQLKTYLVAQRSQGLTVGFVPTMGALHDGHLSLIRASKRKADITVCSIFVNPTQFNNAEDLEKYPRTPHKDAALLEQEGTEVLFLPNAPEIYPTNDTLILPSFDFNGLDSVMEGEFRHGHFEGVASVVYRLLKIVEPTFLFMGQKDFQQWRIVQSMLLQIQSDVQLVRCPISREADGLAMSSRNQRLSNKGRQVAPQIYNTLQVAKKAFDNGSSLSSIITDAEQALQKIEGGELEYFQIVNGKTLQPILQNIQNPHNIDNIVACVAIHIANIRLIDNIILKEVAQ